MSGRPIRSQRGPPTPDSERLCLPQTQKQRRHQSQPDVEFVQSFMDPDVLFRKPRATHRMSGWAALMRSMISVSSANERLRKAGSRRRRFCDRGICARLFRRGCQGLFRVAVEKTAVTFLICAAEKLDHDFSARGADNVVMATNPGQPDGRNSIGTQSSHN